MASIGEETYKGEAITDDPTWIVEWVARSLRELADLQPDRWNH